MRESELDRDHGLRMGYRSLRFQSRICSGHSKLSHAHLLMWLKTLQYLPAAFRIKSTILPMWPTAQHSRATPSPSSPSLWPSRTHGALAHTCTPPTPLSFQNSYSVFTCQLLSVNLPPNPIWTASFIIACLEPCFSFPEYVFMHSLLWLFSSKRVETISVFNHCGNSSTQQSTGTEQVIKS